MRLRSKERRASKELVREQPRAQSPPAAQEPAPGEGVQDYEHLFLLLLVVMLMSALWGPGLLEGTEAPPPPPPPVGRWLLKLTGRL